jgi:dihydrofolate reductase
MNVIVACDKNYGIGKDNKIVWNVKKDMLRFKKYTTSDNINIIIMGKNTFLSFDKPLPNRENFVISKSLYDEIKNNSDIQEHKYILYNGFYIFKTFEHAYNYGNILTSKEGKIWIIGGSILYEYVVNNYKINSFYLTIIDNIYDCDTYLQSNTIQFIKNCNWTNTENIIDKNTTFKFYDY